MLSDNPQDNILPLQEPTNHGELGFDCLQLDGSRFLYYDDDNCNNLKALICERITT